MNRQVATTKTGTIGEDVAISYLKNHGLILIERNFRSKFGEVDLIMKDQDKIVFIEVRYRQTKYFLDPLESIDKKKVKKIIDTCNYFIQTSSNDSSSYRFDIITLTGNLKKPEIDWYQNAFSE